MTVNTENNNKNLNEFKSVPLDIYYYISLSGNALIFSFNKAFIRKFTDLVYENYRFPISFIKDTDLFIKKIYLIKYDVVFLDVDSIFFELKKLLNWVSDSKITKLYLITSSEEIAAEINKFNLHRKIILLLLKEKEMVYLPGGRKYIC